MKWRNQCESVPFHYFNQSGFTYTKNKNHFSKTRDYSDSRLYFICSIWCQNLCCSFFMFYFKIVLCIANTTDSQMNNFFRLYVLTFKVCMGNVLSVVSTKTIVFCLFVFSFLQGMATFFISVQVSQKKIDTRENKPESFYATKSESYKS